MKITTAQRCRAQKSLITFIAAVVCLCCHSDPERSRRRTIPGPFALPTIRTFLPMPQPIASLALLTLCRMAPMRTHPSLIAVLVLLGAILPPATYAADKLKGFYAGGGGISAEVHRVLLIEFAADGTAILQQKW